MPANGSSSRPSNRLLVKLRPGAELGLASRTDIEALYPAEPGRAESGLALAAEGAWFLAEMRESAGSPWDLAHARIANQLGISDSDLLFAEPDLVHDTYREAGEALTAGLAVGSKCTADPQDGAHKKATGPNTLAWHLDENFTELRRARAAVAFAAPRTRIAHLDTGYYPQHDTTPRNILRHLEANFADGERNRTSAEDPDKHLLLLDASGHGTGTLSILAGATFPKPSGFDLGGAPDADILPLRIADSVVLLRTSAFARALHYATDLNCDVASLSMGGLPSRAWREAVDRAYLAGLCLVAAAGNNANGLPTRNTVYPARYARVIGVCGVMADGRPYARLSGLTTLEGNHGPARAMESAISTYTPNIPWARFGCASTVRLNGEGTSSATPQVAAAAALWLEKYKHVLPRDWRRVEAVRHALFSSAKGKTSDPKRLGRGILQANAALGVKPRLELPQTKSDRDSFAFLRVITGLGVSEMPARERMLNLEVMQRWILSADLQALVKDPDSDVQPTDATLTKVMECLIEDGRASTALRRHVASRYTTVVGRPARRTAKSSMIVPARMPVANPPVEPPSPPHRRLRVYAVDPSLSGRLDTAGVNEVTLRVRWEPDLTAGPTGEYLAIDDVDAAGKRHRGVDLNAPSLLAQDGWAPSEGHPPFHQQMVYAVAMKTIEHFERALGRPVLWRARGKRGKPHDDSIFVRQLTIRPHALHARNAYYSPEQRALLFGYFETPLEGVSEGVPGSRIYTCLSHDIITHETTHAILDGMHRRFREPTNPDMLALHEAFADVVALFQHFTIPELLVREIGRTRGDLESESLLGSLAVQFGHATGGRGALRDAIGRMENGQWRRLEPDPTALKRLVTPHARGAVLVAAIFDAFLAIYKSRIADLLRIYTGGTGILPFGSIHPDLQQRLADEAAKSAKHVLTMTIRAVDYLPPVDVTFFEFLRGLVTADYDIVRDDRLNYRVAFIEAFRKHGIFPVEMGSDAPDVPRTLSSDTVRWTGFDIAQLPKGVRARIRAEFVDIINDLKRYADSCFYVADREDLFDATREQRRKLHKKLEGVFKRIPGFAEELGIDAKRKFEVHELRRSIRSSPDGRTIPQVIVILTQSGTVALDRKTGTPEHTFHSGCTLVVDLAEPALKFRIVKNAKALARRKRTAAFVRQTNEDPLRARLLSPGRSEPFAVLHAIAEDEW